MATLSQRSFAGGELAPALHARVDMSRYASGVKTMRNYMVLKSSGAATRPGTTFCGRGLEAFTGFASHVNSPFPRLLPFIFNKDNSYAVVLHADRIHFIKEGVLLKETAKVITGITIAASPVVTTSTNHSYSTGDLVYIEGVVGKTEVNGRYFLVTNLSATTFSLTSVDGSAFAAYSSGGTVQRVYRIVQTNLDYSDIFDIKYVQSADVMTLAHSSNQPQLLSRISDTSWTISSMDLGAPYIDQPGNPFVTGTPGAGDGLYAYAVTAVDELTGEESLESGTTSPGGALTNPDVNQHVIEWDTVTGAGSYNIYQYNPDTNIAGYVGSSQTLQFINDGITADPTRNPPVRIDINRSTSGNYPSAIGYYQQRLAVASTPTDPETVWLSRPGLYQNFTKYLTGQDDDAIEFTLAGRQVTKVAHLMDLAKFVVLAGGGEWTCRGNSEGVITPTAVNPEQSSQNGASDVAPVIVDNTGLYIQDRGAVVRDIGFDFSSDGYKGNDLTTFATHLFEGRSVVDAAYQKTPNSIVWLVMDDGDLLGLTYIRSQEILGWHRHDTDGLVKSICSIPEGNEDVLYLSVARTLPNENGAGTMTHYSLERMASRYVDDIVDYIAMDSTISYDGRNPGDATVTISTSSFVADEVIVVTASASTFVAGDVGNQVFLNFEDADGEVTIVRGDIVVYTSATVVNIKVDRDSPGTWSNAYDWSLAKDSFSQIWHLEGKDVSVMGDGFVVASPNNPEYDIITVEDGQITLDQCYAVVHVGLPFISDLETLDIDSVQAETLSDKKMAINQVTMHLEKTRGIWVGGAEPDDDDLLDGLTEMKVRDDEDPNLPIVLATGKVSVNIDAQWNSNGRIFIRQVDPLPATVLAVSPSGLFPFGGS